MRDINKNKNNNIVYNYLQYLTSVMERIKTNPPIYFRVFFVTCMLDMIDNDLFVL